MFLGNQINAEKNDLLNYKMLLTEDGVAPCVMEFLPITGSATRCSVDTNVGKIEFIVMPDSVAVNYGHWYVMVPETALCLIPVIREFINIHNCLGFTYTEYVLDTNSNTDVKATTNFGLDGNTITIQGNGQIHEVEWEEPLTDAEKAKKAIQDVMAKLFAS